MEEREVVIEPVEIRCRYAVVSLKELADAARKIDSKILKRLVKKEALLEHVERQRRKAKTDLLLAWDEAEERRAKRAFIAPSSPGPPLLS